MSKCRSIRPSMSAGFNPCTPKRRRALLPALTSSRRELDIGHRDTIQKLEQLVHLLHKHVGVREVATGNRDQRSYQLELELVQPRTLRVETQRLLLTAPELCVVPHVGQTVTDQPVKTSDVLVKPAVGRRR